MIHNALQYLVNHAEMVFGVRVNVNVIANARAGCECVGVCAASVQQLFHQTNIRFCLQTQTQLLFLAI